MKSIPRHNSNKHTPFQIKPTIPKLNWEQIISNVITGFVIGLLDILPNVITGFVIGLLDILPNVWF